MSFESPLLLLTLAVLPLGVTAYLVLQRRRLRESARFASAPLLPNVVERVPGLRRHLPAAAVLLAVGALLVGFARPHATFAVSREQATVVLAIDVSRSMTAPDVQPTRLEAAKRAIAQFLDTSPSRFRIGMVAFATRANVVLPATTDRVLARAALAELRPGEGTALGDAVALALRVGQVSAGDAEEGERVPISIFVLSDGASEGGRLTPRAAAEQARAAGVPVHTVVFGSPEGVVERVLPGGFTERIRVPPNPSALQEIARMTGGGFFTAVDRPQLEAVYGELGSRLGKTSEDREITVAFAAGGLVLLLGGAAFSLLWFRRPL